MGQELIPLLEKRNLPIQDLRLFGSNNSAGRTLQTPYGERIVQLLSEQNIEGLDALFFAASAEVSHEWCPRAAEK